VTQPTYPSPNTATRACFSGTSISMSQEEIG
jgi:hypothetical protein